MKCSSSIKGFTFSFTTGAKLGSVNMDVKLDSYEDTIETDVNEIEVQVDALVKMVDTSTVASCNILNKLVDAWLAKKHNTTNDNN